MSLSIKFSCSAFIIMMSIVRLEAQTDPQPSIIPLMEDAEIYIQSIENQRGKVLKLEFGIIEDQRDCLMKLTGGQTYDAYILGDRNAIRDLDLVIEQKSDEGWTEVKSINNSSHKIESSFTPKITDVYNFHLTASRYYSGYEAGRYIIIISFY